MSIKKLDNQTKWQHKVNVTHEEGLEGGKLENG